MTTVQRDPFARTELRRETVTNNGHPQHCQWCGQQRARLYRYGTETDGGRFLGWATGLFCNLGCFKAYHE